MRCITLCIVTAVVLLRADAKIQTISRCYDQGYIPITCPPNFLIRVHNLTYGLSESNVCEYHSGDCVLTEQTSFGCNGRRQCDILITSQTKYFQKLPVCNRIGNYMEVKYECVPESSIVNLCDEERTEIAASEGYAATPYFAQGNYLEHLDCQFRIVGRNIQVQLITVNLTDANDCLTLEHPLSSKTYCGGSSMIENYDADLMPTDQVSIKFKSSNNGHHGGVWIYYTMEPIAPQATEPHTTTSTLPSRIPTLSKSVTRLLTKFSSSTTTKPVIKSWTARVDDSNIMIYNNVSTHVSGDTLAMILGLIFGIFGSVVLSLFLVYFVKRYRDHKRKKLRRQAYSESLDQEIWRNVTNECLSNILQKHDGHVDQSYSNNIMSKDNNSMTLEYKDRIEHSYC